MRKDDPLNEKKQEAITPKTKKVVRQQFVCRKKCYHNKLYRVGDYAYFGDGEGPRGKDGELMHFIPVGDAEAVNVRKDETVKVNQGK